jgi:hypothetical protein
MSTRLPQKESVQHLKMKVLTLSTSVINNLELFILHKSFDKVRQAKEYQSETGKGRNRLLGQSN